ncbi:hypothetical protein NDU88_005974 [Pleurodeles waltl]|uniref:Uncharacterized protein n=1 Tax=Pleurodeles waltl TaxID=8319 RepID=A0AAV7X2U2_PLEWA|nr:hypothetical protein NDU88_005974 [Pleurodeles waltl]
MDARVLRAMELLKEAGRLDLLAAPAASRDRPVRRAASGVAAAVAACSPPRERKQVSGAGRGRGGRLSPSFVGGSEGRMKGQPRPLGARRPQRTTTSGGKGGRPTPAGLRQLRQPGRLRSGRAGAGGRQREEKAAGGRGPGMQSAEEESEEHEPAGLAAAAVLEGEGQRAPGAGGEQEKGVGGRSRCQGGVVSSRIDMDLDFFQGARYKSQDGDPGELVAGSEPWEDEEVLAGPSAASWTGRRRDGKAVRAMEVTTQSTSGQGFAPPRGWVSKRPGYALQRAGGKTPLRRPCIPAPPIEEFIKKARLGRDEFREYVADFYCAGEITLPGLYGTALPLRIIGVILQHSLMPA